MKTSTPFSSTEAKVVTTAVPTPEPVTTPAPPAETPAPPASVPTPAAVPIPVAVPVPAAEPTAETTPAANSNGWTGMEDTLIIGMKAQGKTWKEIHDALPMKSKNDLKQRFKELSNDAKENDKNKAVSFAGENGKNKKDGKKGVLRAEGDDSDRTDDEGIDPRGPFTRDFKSFQKGKKSTTFKIIEVDSDEEQPADLRGHPIVYMDPDEGLTEAHVGCPVGLILIIADTTAVDEDSVQADAEERRGQVAGDRIEIL